MNLITGICECGSVGYLCPGAYTDIVKVPTCETCRYEIFMAQTLFRLEQSWDSNYNWAL
jgi:hypothetical protein